MASIPRIISRIKSQLDEHLSRAQINRACADAQYQWRDRVLDPATTLQLFALQILHGNVACRALRHLGAMNASPAAYCKARARLPLDIFGTLVASACALMCGAADEVGKWRGHRVWYLDGTSTSLPDTAELRRAFGKPSRMNEGCGFPVAHLMMLMDAATGFVGDIAVSQWNTADMAKAPMMHASLGEGDVLVGDRAFGTYVHLTLLLQQKMHGMCRMHHRRTPVKTSGRKRSRKKKTHGKRTQKKSTMRVLRKLGPDDFLVEIDRPNQKPKWMSLNDWRELPKTIIARQVSYRVVPKGHRTRQVTLLTTLTDEQAYPKKALTELYGARWEIETNFRHLKTTMGMDVLRCKSVDGVTKELWMYVLVYNLVRRVMLDEAQRRDVAPGRVSFIDALDALRLGGGLGEMALVINPVRPGRMQPRVIKRPKDRYRYMTRPRDTLRQELLDAEKEVAA